MGFNSFWYKMLDKNKRQLQSWDLFRFTDGWQLIYETFKKWDKLLFKWYSFQSRKDFDTKDLSDFKFEIVGDKDWWFDDRYYDVIKRERMKNWEHFLDS